MNGVTKLCCSAFIYLSTLSPIVSASNCDNQADNELEKLYCQIITQNTKHQLPSLLDFRKNTEQMQRLLIKRDAKKLGLSLPAKKQDSSKAKPARPQRENQSSLTTNQPKSRKTEPKGEVQNTNSRRLSSCRLNKAYINCATTRFTLQTNKPNSSLHNTALSAANTLLFSNNKNSDTQYLNQSYLTYIDKMMLIGLGDSTMSYTKFHKLFTQNKQNRHQFSQRFNELYELLKKEKQSMAIRTRYNDQYPASIKQCMKVNNKLIICDNVQQNWIYISSKH
ncbi:hypothetical protein [Agaribacterium sp. ZY112]|uniref:hypothetical protein n=1 Tax=Agaribacterium sp. ZY112 TaxID=3233574 RepID=UPI003525513A